MKIYFETLGCPKNYNDTQAAKGILLDGGFTISESPEDADTIVVNTCGFINDAKKESIDTILEMAEYKSSGKKLVVSGCLSKRYGEELFEEMPEVDLFIGVNEYEMLPQLLEDLDNRKKVVAEHDEQSLPKRKRYLEGSKYTQTLKIAEGCDNRCAFCIIPAIRGGFRSKTMEDVLSEAEELAAQGCKELILIAQDLTNYGKDLYGELKLARLVKSLCRIEGIEWIRLMYCYEDKITDELIQVMATEPKVCKYIDIPIQHASNRVLKDMRRRSTRASLESTIKRLKEGVKGIHIRTTLIVGFPGESEEDFEELFDFVEESQFARLGVFAYSQEENTAAGDREDQVDEAVKEERLNALMTAQLDISYSQNRQKIGESLKVLVEYRDEDGSYVGRTEFDAPEIDNGVIFTSDRKLEAGDMVQVLITDAFDYDLVGKEIV